MSPGGNKLPMNYHQFLRVIAISFLGLLASACAAPGKVYPVSFEDTRELLASSSELDILVLPGKVLAFNSSESTDNMLVWDVHHEGAPLLRFKANLTPENALSTRVAVSMEAAPTENGKDIQKRIDERPTVRTLYVKAAEEAVGARIERREFNYTAIQREVLAASVVAIREMQSGARASMAAASKRDGDNIRSAYSAEGDYYRSSSSSTVEPQSEYDRQKKLEERSAPSVDLSKYNRGY